MAGFDDKTWTATDADTNSEVSLAISPVSGTPRES